MWRRILGWFRRGGEPGRTRNPFPPEDSRHEAFEALRAYAEARGTRRRRAPGSELKELVLRETPDDLPGNRWTGSQQVYDERIAKDPKVVTFQAEVRYHLWLA